MDSHGQEILDHAKRHNLPQTDEGPYYHDAWWEAYKGGVKGLMGGLLIGATVGAGIGLVVAGALAAFGVAGLGLAAAPAIIGAFSAGGMLVGAHEFITVGIVAGSDAASQEMAELRGKSELRRAVGEIKAELAEIRTLVKGGSEQDARAQKTLAQAEIPDETQDKRTRHYDDDHRLPRGGKLFFWNVGTIGALLGAAAGALLIAGGAPAVIMEFIGANAAEALGGASFGSQIAGAAIAGGAMGASFGINRDLFRAVFDVTDHWFRGSWMPPKTSAEPAPNLSRGPSQMRMMSAQAEPMFLVQAPQTDKSPTFYRDKIRLAEAAQKALSELDHHSATRH